MATSDAVSLLASLVTPDGRRWGERASGRQWADARAVLEDRRRQSYITRPRGGAKTEDGGGMVVAALLTQLPRQSRSYGAAVDREQAQLLVDSVGGFADRTPGLSSLRVDSLEGGEHVDRAPRSRCWRRTGRAPTASVPMW